MKTRTKMLIVACGITAAAICSGCKQPSFGKKTVQAAPPAEKIKVAVSVAKAVRQELLQERKILAALQAYRDADVGPLAPGRVKSLPVQIGDYVKQGQIVARMDDATLVATEAQFASIKSQYERSQSLYQSNALPKAQFEGIEAQYTAMKRQLESLRENTTIVAPFAGVVTSRAVEEGELYSAPMAPMPGQSKGLLRITQLDPLKIDLSVDDQTVQHVKKGMQVRLIIDQAADTSALFGRVEYVNPQADASSQAFGVRVVVPNRNNRLRPGFFAEVHIILDKKQNALCVPRSSVVDEKLFVVENGMALSKKVSVGWLTDNFAEILSGINENETVVVKGNKALPDSAQISIQ